MMSKFVSWVKPNSLVLASIAILATSAPALALTITGGSGGAVVGGWIIQPDLGVTLDITNGTITSITASEFVDDQRTLGGLSILFAQSSEPAASTISFSNATVKNSSGQVWEGIDFIISPLGDAGPSFASQASTFTPVSPFGLEKFTPTDVTYYGGALANMQTIFFGTDKNPLVINADPLATADQLFYLKIIPTTYVPEPSSVAILSVAGAGLCSRRRKHDPIY